ncbi:MAG: hypothetical protein CMI16_04820 [Opitutaceae bacterium]|nr:hypothetical protein [Opitutaceae bacterium]|tara:strand:- start:298 stop:594 length:297 start_codon:yes stop_codon:yes gene_type:complete
MGTAWSKGRVDHLEPLAGLQADLVDPEQRFSSVQAQLVDWNEADWDPSEGKTRFSSPPEGRALRVKVGGVVVMVDSVGNSVLLDCRERVGPLEMKEEV